MISGRRSEHDVGADRVFEAGVDLLGHGGAAEHVAPLEHEHLAARAGEIRRVHQAVVAAADDDDVVIRHAPNQTRTAGSRKLEAGSRKPEAGTKLTTNPRSGSGSRARARAGGRRTDAWRSLILTVRSHRCQPCLGWDVPRGASRYRSALDTGSVRRPLRASIRAASACGGMGQVFLRARHPGCSGRVALKYLASLGARRGRAQAAILREARAAAQDQPSQRRRRPRRLRRRRPHLRVVMEYVDGESPSRAASRAASEACPRSPASLDRRRSSPPGLSAAHAQGIIHRDLQAVRTCSWRVGGAATDSRLRRRQGDFATAPVDPIGPARDDVGGRCRPRRAWPRSRRACLHVPGAEARG